MTFPKSLHARCRDLLPPAAWRLLDAILSNALMLSVETPLLSASKEAVLDCLTKSEGNRPDSDAIRQRLQTIKKLWISDSKFRVNGQMLLSIKSRKDAYVIEWSAVSLGLLMREETRKAVNGSGHSDYMDTVGSVVPVDIDIEDPIHYVLVSHKWEGEDTEAILNKFVQDLQRQLENPPIRSCVARTPATLISVSI